MKNKNEIKIVEDYLGRPKGISLKGKKVFLSIMDILNALKVNKILLKKLIEVHCENKLMENDQEAIKYMKLRKYANELYMKLRKYSDEL